MSEPNAYREQPTALASTEASDFNEFVKSLPPKKAKELRSLSSDIKLQIKTLETTYNKVVNHADSIDYKLDQARAIFGEKNGHLFEAWKAAEFSGLTTSRAYELRSIAQGRKTIEKIREETRKRVADHRKRQRSGGHVTDPRSVTPKVTVGGQQMTAVQIAAMSGKAKATINGAADPVGYSQEVLGLGNGVDPDASAAARKDAYDDPPPPPANDQAPVPALTPEEISDDCLTAFKKVLGRGGKEWTYDDLRAARKYFAEQKKWIPKDRWAALRVVSQ